MNPAAAQRLEPRTVPRWRRGVALGIGAVLLTGLVTWPLVARRSDRAALALLRSPNPEQRQTGAGLAAREHTPEAWRAIAGALNSGTEADPAVRETLVYALGRSGEPAYFDTVATIVAHDLAPTVRQSAWVAAARLSPERCRALATRPPLATDAWDRLGRACAWLELGDPRDADELLHWATVGDPDLRRTACAALYRGVAPLLEAVGHWPLWARVHEGETWPPELVAEVRRRCAAFDLKTLSEDTRPHVMRAVSVRQNIGRLNAARDVLARVLFTP